MAEHNELGKKGEELARKHLQKNGYEVLHTNWVPDKSKNELDIVAKKDNVLVIVEVKSRSTDSFEHPKDAITAAKIRRIVKATHDYIFTFDSLIDTRFDIISVLPNKQGGFLIEHIEDAFLPPIN